MKRKKWLANIGRETYHIFPGLVTPAQELTVQKTGEKTNLFQ
jgi:hypothetical protein